MKNTMEYSDGTYERYLERRGKKMATLKGITVNGKDAQQMDFYKAEHPDGTVRYYIGIVFRGAVSDYSGKRTWLEDRYVVDKEEGNRIYTQIKQTKAFTNENVKTY